MTKEHIYKNIESIVFSFLSPQDIKKMAVAKVVTPELYDKEGYPVDGGLMDIRLGVIDPGLRCKVCGSKLKECVGHFGYMELARPVVHIHGIKVIHDFLISTCRECGKLLLEEKDVLKHKEKLQRIEKEKGLDFKRKYIRTIITKLKAVKKCPHCKSKQFKITIEKPTIIIENDKRIFPIEIRSRLEKINDEDIEFLGLNPEFCRPEWMVLTLMLIPPVTIRPSITLESGERSEDDLTHKLGDIVRINQRLFENINAGAPEIIIEDLWDLLQYHITTFFDNSISSIPPARHRSGEPLKTLAERIKSKEGRFRHNLIGKRVNYSARTLISPDPYIDLNEVGVPLVVALELTVPERVTEWNIDRLKEFIKRGPDTYPGANYVIRPDGKKKKITDETKEQLLEELQFGYIVERHLMDGDISIFNRQPSLHRMSIMCHKVKVLPGRSFRLNPSVCVAPDTKVMMADGYVKKIKDLKNTWENERVITCNWKDNRKIEKTNITAYHEVPEGIVDCWEIKTESGRKIKVTGDHPFYTNKGIIEARNLKEGYKVGVYPIDLPEYEDRNDTILTKKDIEKVIPKNSNIKHIINTLERLKLLPLRMNNPKLPILTKLLGHIFGDGSLIHGRSGSKGISRKSLILYFRGNICDLDSIKEDIMKIGLSYKQKIISKIYKSSIRLFNNKIKNVSGISNWFSMKSQPLGSLLLALGTPMGRKTNLDYRLPKWLINAPLYIQRNFLASYFGSELTKPVHGTRSKKRIRVPVFKIQKREDLMNSGINLANDICSLLKNFGIRNLALKKEMGNIRKDNSITKTIVVSISSKTNNLISLFGKIGYGYAAEKEKLARHVYYYLKYKKYSIDKRINKFKKTKELYKNAISPLQISTQLNIPRGTVSTWLYRKEPKLNYTGKDFPDFPIFIDNATKNLSDSGIVWEKINAKKAIKSFKSIDITVLSPNHNFMANSFSVKNCTPYNADFDGDEMNLHIPQNEEAIAEAEILMQVQTQIITPKNGLNIVAAIQDSVTGNFLLTREMEFTRQEAISLLLSIGIEDLERLPKTKTITGKQVFSTLLPPNFNFIGNSLMCKKCEKCKREKCDIDAYVSIKNGNLISGIIDKATIGKEAGDLLRNLYAQYGPSFTLDLLGKISRLGIKVLLNRGFTISLTDTDLDKATSIEIKTLIENTEQKVDDLIQQYKDGKLEAYPSKTLEETLELKIQMVLNRIRNQVGDLVLAKTTEDNSTLIMAHSGAQGNPLHLAQTAAIVGQQILRGERINKGYTDRTLSIFKKNDLKPYPHGFIKNSYKHGLGPYEYFFHAMTGRDSLMDTALRTPKSGYLYRRLANALQDMKIEYDRTVRSADKKIVQFVYGDDHIDISKSEGGTINVKKIVKEVVEGAI